jgi:hypothetical protein
MLGSFMGTDPQLVGTMAFQTVPILLSLFLAVDRVMGTIGTTFFNISFVW